MLAVHHGYARIASSAQTYCSGTCRLACATSAGTINMPRHVRQMCKPTRRFSLECALQPWIATLMHTCPGYRLALSDNLKVLMNCLYKKAMHIRTTANCNCNERFKAANWTTFKHAPWMLAPARLSSSMAT